MACVCAHMCIYWEHTHSPTVSTTYKWEQQGTDWEGEIQATPRVSANSGSLLQQCKQTVTPQLSAKRKHLQQAPESFPNIQFFLTVQV